MRLLARVDAITPPMDRMAGSSARRKASDITDRCPAVRRPGWDVT